MANEPITREEMLLNAVATGEAANLDPITREEMFLAKLGGAEVNTPTPITRKEQFLQKAIENAGSGGSGGSGGGGGGLATGTMTFAEAQLVYDNPTVVAHNLGYVPNNLLWFVEETSSKDASDGLDGARKAGFSYISPSVSIYCNSVTSATSGNNMGYKFIYKESIYTNANANESDVTFFGKNNGYIPNCRIPAGSTIRWLVW